MSILDGLFGDMKKQLEDSTPQYEIVGKFKSDNGSYCHLSDARTYTKALEFVQKHKNPNWLLKIKMK